jgi:hypothetical protein
VVPNGFELKWSLQLDVNPITYEKCDKIKKDASLRLVQVAIEGCEKRIGEIRMDLQQHERTSGQASVSRLNLRTKGKTLPELEKDLRQTKHRKLAQFVTKDRQRGTGNAGNDMNWFDMAPAERPGGESYRDSTQQGNIGPHCSKGNTTVNNTGVVEQTRASAHIHSLENAPGCRVRAAPIDNDASIDNARDATVRDVADPNVNNADSSRDSDAPVGSTTGNIRTNDAPGSNATDNQTVINLSDKSLSKAQTQLLSKGFNFIPAREKIDITKLLSDLSEWERRMRLKEYFYDKDTGAYVEPEPWKKKKSNFTPESGRDRWLDTYIEMIKNDVIQGLNKSCQMNITREEQEALKDLLDDEGIVIRPADKGSGAVVVNTAEYMKELVDDMKKSHSYRETEDAGVTVAVRGVKKIADKLYKDGHIDKDLKKYLTPKYPQSGKLKGNPKLHKSGNPYRHIVSGIGTPTERLAEVAEKELEDFVVGSDSYIKDTTDFLQKIQSVPQPIPENAILFCFDVVKLYPSIPKQEGLAACREALDSRTQPDIPTKGVLEMIKTVLDNNNFTFCGKNYTQMDGVAIGSKLGKNYACSYMRKWDEALTADTPNLSFYKRFIDDGFGIWIGSTEELEQFRQKANAIHKNIQVELRWSRTQIEFLDLMVRKEDGRLRTDLYVKPTDKHVYVASDSCHPTHVKRAIPYGLGVRLKRICDDEQSYKTRRNELKTQLKSRGYKSGFIESQLKRVDRLDRTQLINRSKTVKTNTDRVPLVVTYSKVLPDIHNIVRKNMRILYQSERMCKIFEKPPLIAYRRDRNLADILVHGKLNKIQERYEQNEFRCSNGCRVCDALKPETSIRSANARKPFNVNTQKFGCKTKNVVYAIYCEECDKPVYIGETERTLGERLREHMADVRLERNTPVAGHFKGRGHGLSELKIVVLERICDESRNYRLIKERDWIKRLQTEAPYGVNKKCSLRFL